MCRLAGAVAARTNVLKSLAVGALCGHFSIALQRAACARHRRQCRYEFTGFGVGGCPG